MLTYGFKSFSKKNSQVFLTSLLKEKLNTRLICSYWNSWIPMNFYGGEELINFNDYYRYSIMIFCPIAHCNPWHCHSLCAALQSNVGTWGMWACSLYFELCNNIHVKQACLYGSQFYYNTINFYQEETAEQFRFDTSNPEKGQKRKREDKRGTNSPKKHRM